MRQAYDITLPRSSDRLLEIELRDPMLTFLFAHTEQNAGKHRTDLTYVQMIAKPTGTDSLSSEFFPRLDVMTTPRLAAGR